MYYKQENTQTHTDQNYRCMYTYIPRILYMDAKLTWTVLAETKLKLSKNLLRKFLTRKRAEILYVNSFSFTSLLIKIKLLHTQQFPSLCKAAAHTELKLLKAALKQMLLKCCSHGLQHSPRGTFKNISDQEKKRWKQHYLLQWQRM